MLSCLSASQPKLVSFKFDLHYMPHLLMFSPIYIQPKISDVIVIFILWYKLVTESTRRLLHALLQEAHYFTPSYGQQHSIARRNNRRTLRTEKLKIKGHMGNEKETMFRLNIHTQVLHVVKKWAKRIEQ